MGRSCLLVIVLSFALLGCGVQADQKPTQDACNAWCVAYAKAAFPSDGSMGCMTPLYGGMSGMGPQVDQAQAADSCRTQECVPLQGASMTCQTILKVMYECELGQPDLCADTGCETQMAAVNTGCP
ncbi:MAG TPA: hypothetical protein VKQ32_09985 [Polyangia bacterium]|nr:hypothetical protein [Polyangia bacterium]